MKLEIRNLKLGFLLSLDVDFRKPNDFGYIKFVKELVVNFRGELNAIGLGEKFKDMIH